MPRPPALRSVDPEVAELADLHGRDPQALVALLAELQARRGTLTSAAIADAARALQLPLARAQGVATFYSMLNTADDPRPIARVCDGPACWLKGAAAAHQQLHAEFGRLWRVERASCLGLCDRAPAAWLDGKQSGPLLSGAVLLERDRWQGEAQAYARPHSGEVRVMLARAGVVDPDSLESALRHGAYRALAQALEHPPEKVVAEVEAAGHTGR